MGRFVEEEIEVNRVALEYFEMLFTTHRVKNVDEVLTGVNKCIFEDMSDRLNRSFIAEDICVMLRSMSLLKASWEV